jgi:tetratricopeptide (TPR) repeat protein
MPAGKTTATRRRARKTGGPTTPDPIEIAMESVASGASPTGVAHEVLQRQSALLRWQIATQRAAFVMRLLLAAASLTVAGVLVALVWSASLADGLIIEAFETPPDIAAQGYSSSALAAQLLDRLNRMQRETVADRSATVLREARDADVKIEIPTTGVSLGELDRWLRATLGHETAVRGELVKLETGPQAPALALSVRIGGQPGVQIVSPSRDVNELLERGAEEVFKTRDLARYLAWLVQRGRFDDARAHAQALAEIGPAAQRSVALDALAYYGGTTENMLRLERRAVQLDPSNCSAWNGVGNGAHTIGRVEEARAAWARAIDCFETQKGLSPAGRRLNLTLNRMNVMNVQGARWDALQQSCILLGVRPCTPAAIEAAARGGLAGNETDPNFHHRLRVTTRILAAERAPSAAARLLPFQAPADPMAPIAREWLITRGFVAVAAEDWPSLLDAAAQLDAHMAAQRAAGTMVGRGLAWPIMFRPLALARLGRQAEAEATAAALPADCYFCLVVRAQVAAAKGDRATAERWFAEAIRQGPFTAYGYAEAGAARLAWGDPDGALAVARAGHKASPRAAGPLEVWGEALLAKGKARDAAARFAAAAPYSPLWGHLHLKWGEALAAQGKTDQARSKWRTAAEMDLSPADRRRVETLLQQRPT